MSLGTHERDRDGLLAALEQVDVEGWDGPVGRDLLAEMRHTVVLPLVAQIGLHGVVAEQAVSTGWAVAWEVLRAPSTRAAQSPRGVVWVAVRRAILNEHVAAMYGTAPREAWRQVARDRDSVRRPLSLEALRAAGWEPVAEAPVMCGPIIPLVVNLLVEVGWERRVAQDVMEAVAQAAPWGPTSGWRWIANRVDAEPWQVRRLIETLVAHGPRLTLWADTGSADRSLEVVRTQLLTTVVKRRAAAVAS